MPLSIPRQVPGSFRNHRSRRFDEGGKEIGYRHVAGGAGTAQDYRPTVAVSIDASHDEGQGHNVGGVFAGEWLAYTVDVRESGDYVFDFRLACPGGGGTFHVEAERRDVTGPVVVPNTGHFQRWQTVSKTSVHLDAGRQLLRIVFDTQSTIPWGERHVCNLNWIKVRPAVARVPGPGRVLPPVPRVNKSRLPWSLSMPKVGH
jgi:hypothetical protein